MFNQEQSIQCFKYGVGRPLKSKAAKKPLSTGAAESEKEH
jgi:hypothetical protein